MERSKIKELIQIKQDLMDSFTNFNIAFREDETDGICISDVEFVLYNHHDIIAKLDKWLLEN